MSLYFVLEYQVGFFDMFIAFFDMFIALMLQQYKVIIFCSIPWPLKKHFIQNNCVQCILVSIYSISTVDNDMYSVFIVPCYHITSQIKISSWHAFFVLHVSCPVNVWKTYNTRIGAKRVPNSIFTSFTNHIFNNMFHSIQMGN